MFLFLIWAVLLPLAGGALYHFLGHQNFRNATVIGVFIAVLTLMAVVLFYRETYQTPEKPGEGVLIPANDPSPENICLKLEEQRPPDSPFPKIPPNATFFYVGPVVLYWLPDDPTSIEVITLNDKSLLTINRTPKGFTIDADLFNPAGNLMARIRENKFIVVIPETSYSERPDPSTLIVRDKKGDEALYVRFMNPSAARIRGTFLTTSGVPIAITDTTITRTTTREVLQIGGQCLHNTKRGLIFN